MLSDAQLAAYSKEHLYYEVVMFFALGQILTSLPEQKTARGQAINNALGESFAIHLRNLIAFFYHDSFKPDDVLAEHFVYDSAQWKAILPAASDTLNNAKVRAHKEVAHLTTARIGGVPAEKSWSVRDLMNELIVILKLFVKSASPQRLHQRVADLVGQL